MTWQKQESAATAAAALHLGLLPAALGWVMQCPTCCCDATNEGVMQHVLTQQASALKQPQAHTHSANHQQTKSTVQVEGHRKVAS